jgi:biopolymer transport protein ExbD
MKLARRHKEGAEVSTESLNDIMFFLLLFFLIISTLANPSVLKLTLPSSAASEQMQKQQIKIEVDANHNYVINGTPIPFTDLENALKIELQGKPDAKVVLSFDNSLTIQDLADVMQIGYKLGVKMVLATKATSK